MSTSPPSIISIINISQDLSVPMADITRAFFIYCQEYSATGTPLGKETTTGVEFIKANGSPRVWSLTPLNDTFSIHAIFKNPLIIQNILDDPRIGGLKLVVYYKGYIPTIRNHLTSQGVLDQNRSLVV
ncbi:hypothetical protein N7449_001572 [Penicillium cf. viridicatum]|uniref:Uncharacterized protein n=1 Tax=Penicillium cf. viridicatum TaxID=2972119 RepID=A0A9W9N8G9_9EURO|nr:hypothetical protein N7449_001572 [Penicillium cf. viridicatum]